MVNLRELLISSGLTGQIVTRSDGLDLSKIIITGVSYDSRLVEEGNIYVALKGLSVDGHAFIQQAIQQGALAICGMKAIESLDVPYFQVEDSRVALAYLSAAFVNFPGKRMTVIGVTGTDGKTTTSHFIYNILREAGYPTGMITTVSARFQDREIDTGFHVTTPEAPQIQALLAQMIGTNPPTTHVVLETTSHGLAQKRVAGCFYDIGVFTNITHEHLDFHGSYEEYRGAKAELIRELAEAPVKIAGNYRLAVLNYDDSSFSFLKGRALEYPHVKTLTYGLSSQAELQARNIQLTKNKPRFEVYGPAGRGLVELSIMGQYNVYNALAAWGATVEGLGIAADAASQGLKKVKFIPGRMEPIDCGQAFMALVDFAHTPNAIHQALRSARTMTKGRVIAVFGSAGLRDREKRAQMAEIGVKLADFCILTAEDPRTEDLGEILTEMKKGAEKGGGIENQTYQLVRDRREAVRRAVGMAGENDLVILLGKGHEQSMCFGTIEYAWDDRVALKSAIAEKLGIPGPEMPYLPD